MHRSRIRAAVSISLVLVPLALLAAACSRPPEQQMLTQFFRAARSRDNTTTSVMSAVSLDPREQGAVESFTITSVSPEQRAPLDFKALIAAEGAAKTAEAEFQARKREYSNANLPVIEQVLKLERDPKAKLTAAQQAVKTVWDKWRTDTGTFTKALSGARAAIVAAGGPAQASLSQPGQPAFDPKVFEGEVVRKDVALTAQVTSPENEKSEKNLTVTMERVVGTLNGTVREGRWIITRIAGI